MTVCRFFLQGHCKFGNQCKFEHPSKATPVQSRNPFAPLQEASGSRSPSNFGRASSSKDPQNLPFSLNKKHVTTDLLNERPQWILSAYAPGRDVPIQLFGGFPREQSFEEMRIRHYQLSASGKQQEALQEAQNLVIGAETQIKQALEDVDGAIKYILDGEKQHPNRIDICKASTTNTPLGNTPASNIQNSSFGQPSSLGTFGQPSAPPASQSVNPASGFNKSATAFGQPSFGQPSFGQPSFGQPSFGQPSALNRSAPGPVQSNSAFGTASQANPAPFSGFQQSNPFQQSPQPNPFAVSAHPQPNKPFENTASSLGQNAFTQSGSQAIASSGNSGAGSGAFASTASAPMNQQSQARADSSKPFARAGPTQPDNSGQPSIRPGSTAQIEKDNTGRLTKWNGLRVSYLENEPCYRGNDNEWRKVWFPDGPPIFSKPGGVPEDAYSPLIKGKYEYLQTNGRFEHDEIPLIPPRKEWCEWNL